MNPLLMKIAEMIDPGAFKSRKKKVGVRELRAIRRARSAVEVMFDAPKDILIAGSLYADSEKDLNVWNGMLNELLRG